MAYTINKTDGSILTEIIDSSIDTVATDLTLIGKNVTGYGEYLNENFVKLLENFSSSTEPTNPITGQLWFDLTETKLKVYDGNGFRNSSGPVVSNTTPLSPSQGDLWIDNIEKQIYFFDGVRQILVGPIYKDSQKLSGFFIDTVTDIDGNQRVLTQLKSNDILLGTFSSNLEFQSSTGQVYKTGFTPNPDLLNFKFHARSTSSDALVDINGNLKTVDSFMSTESNTSTTGTVAISNATPLQLGVAGENIVTVNTSQLQIRSNINDQIFKITTRANNTWTDAITITPSTALGTTTVVIDGTLRATTNFKLPLYSTTDRNLYSKFTNGDVIYNTTTNKVQAYANGVWVDLH